VSGRRKGGERVLKPGDGGRKEGAEGEGSVEEVALAPWRGIQTISQLPLEGGLRLMTLFR